MLKITKLKRIRSSRLSSAVWGVWGQGGMRDTLSQSEKRRKLSISVWTSRTSLTGISFGLCGISGSITCLLSSDDSVLWETVFEGKLLQLGRKKARLSSSIAKLADSYFLSGNCTNVPHPQIIFNMNTFKYIWKAARDIWISDVWDQKMTRFFFLSFRVFMKQGEDGTRWEEGRPPCSQRGGPSKHEFWSNQAGEPSVWAIYDDMTAVSSVPCVPCFPMRAWNRLWLAMGPLLHSSGAPYSKEFTMTWFSPPFSIFCSLLPLKRHELTMSYRQRLWQAAVVCLCGQRGVRRGLSGQSARRASLWTSIPWMPGRHGRLL